jgi:hypothetical protein
MKNTTTLYVSWIVYLVVSSIVIHFIETTQNYTMLCYMYCLKQKRKINLIKYKHKTFVDY